MNEWTNEASHQLCMKYLLTGWMKISCTWRTVAMENVAPGRLVGRFSWWWADMIEEGQAYLTGNLLWCWSWCLWACHCTSEKNENNQFTWGRWHLSYIGFSGKRHWGRDLHVGSVLWSILGVTPVIEWGEQDGQEKEVKLWFRCLSWFPGAALELRWFLRLKKEDQVFVFKHRPVIEQQ